MGAITLVSRKGGCLVAGLDLSVASIMDMSRLIGDGRLSPVELVQATLERVERLDPTLKAFITVSGDHALKEARRLEQEAAAGRLRGPLHGIPFTLKDVIATKGIRTTYGHPRLLDFEPQEERDGPQASGGRGGRSDRQGVLADRPRRRAYRLPQSVGHQQEPGAPPAAAPGRRWPPRWGCCP